MTIRSKIALLSSGSIVSQLIPLAFTPLLTRVYSPEDFGLFAIYFSASSLIAVGGSLKYEQGIILSNNRAEISGFYYTSLLIGLASSIIVSGLFYLIPNRWVSTPYDFLVLLLFCASSIFIQSLTLLTLKLEATRDLAISKIVLTTTTVAFQFLIAVKFITMTGSGLILGAIVGNLACILFLLKVTSGKLHPLKSSGDHIRIMETIKSRTEYPLKILPAALLNSASTQIPVLGFASLFGTHFAGQFGLANRVMNIPSAFIGSSIGQIYLQQISKNKSDSNHIQQLTRKLSILLFTVSTPLACLFMMYGGSIFSLFFGIEWQEAGRQAEILTPWFMVVFIASPLSNSLIVLEKFTENLFFNIFLFISRIAVIFIGAKLTSSSEANLAIFSATGFISWIIMLLYILNICKAHSSKLTLLIITSIAAITLTSIASYYN